MNHALESSVSDMFLAGLGSQLVVYRKVCPL